MNRPHTAPPQPLNRPAATLLRDAAELIDHHGLFQGEYWPTTDGLDGCYIAGDPCCALGGLALAAGIDDAQTADDKLDRDPVLICALDALTAEVTRQCDDQDINPGADAPVAWWNDEPTRHPGEVTAALRTAADRIDPPDPGPPDPLNPAGPGGSSAKTSHQATSSHNTTRTTSTEPNHQDDSKETHHV